LKKNKAKKHLKNHFFLILKKTSKHYSNNVNYRLKVLGLRPPSTRFVVIYASTKAIIYFNQQEAVTSVDPLRDGLSVMSQPQQQQSIGGSV